VGADLNAIARRWAERRREAGTAEVVEAVELLTRLLATVRGELLGTTLTAEGDES
jgi:hypothetical protein